MEWNLIIQNGRPIDAPRPVRTANNGEASSLGTPVQYLDGQIVYPEALRAVAPQIEPRRRAVRRSLEMLRCVL